MRYRPFGRGGGALSSISVRLGASATMRGPDFVRGLVYAALEQGVNAYVLETADPVLSQMVGEALSAVERDLVTVVLTLGSGDGRRGSARDFSPEGLTHALDRVLQTSGLGWIDVALLDQPGENELPQMSLQALKAQRSAGRARLLGVAGDGEVMDAYVSTGAFDVLATPYHVNASWQIRSRIRAARERDMAVMAYGYFPAALARGQRAAPAATPVRRGLFGIGGGREAAPTDAAPPDAFAFLHYVQGWTAEQLCLAFVLTDPAMSSVVVDVDTAERLAQIIDVPERDLPAGLAAQIEMARVRGAAA
jgi:aryl-alcohol dehydrogenase-like predicted oxidoreductase